MTVGILALQGCVEPHVKHFEALGQDVMKVKRPEDFKNIDRLLIPGGESSTMLRLLKVYELEEVLEEVANKIPVWGICAGAILMASKLTGHTQKSFNLIDMTIERNAYGSQLDSFQDEVSGYEVSYIRAPKIISCEPTVEVMARQNENPVWLVQGNKMATTFHPELNLNTPSPMHKFFMELK